MSEQRYRAVPEVGAAIPVTEVAGRYGVSRQSVHTWLLRYRREGIAGLEDRSHRVHNHPWRIAAEVEELVCELRRGHPEWGPRRLVFEMGRRGRQVTRSSVYRALVRNGLVEPKSRRRRRKDYRRWERGTPMELWQLGVTASAFLTNAAEVKIVTGVDDHSRFCVIAKAVMRATDRPVCQAFVDAMRTYGIPEEVLTDNGKVFTGRFHKPGVPVEVLFDKICQIPAPPVLSRLRSTTGVGRYPEHGHEPRATGQTTAAPLRPPLPASFPHRAPARSRQPPTSRTAHPPAKAGPPAAHSHRESPSAAGHDQSTHRFARRPIPANRRPAAGRTRPDHRNQPRSSPRPASGLRGGASAGILRQTRSHRPGRGRHSEVQALPGPPGTCCIHTRHAGPAQYPDASTYQIQLDPEARPPHYGNDAHSDEPPSRVRRNRLGAC